MLLIYTENPTPNLVPIQSPVVVASIYGSRTQKRTVHSTIFSAYVQCEGPVTATILIQDVLNITKRHEFILDISYNFDESYVS